MKTEIKILLIVAGILFFWFALRPSIIRSVCSKRLDTEGGVPLEIWGNPYKACLHKWGLE